MRTPTKSDVSVIEYADGYHDIIRSIGKATEYEEVLKYCVVLLSMEYVSYVGSVRSYNQNTGKPEKFYWEPYSAWNGRVYSYSGNNNIGIKKLEEAINKENYNTKLFLVQNQILLVSHGNYDGYSSSYLSVITVNPPEKI
jgi:hypothetical protein